VIILDTNVISEFMRERPAPAVMRWAEPRPPSSLYATSISEAEILRGIEQLPKGKRRDALLAAARQAFTTKLSGRVLPFGSDAAKWYAVISAERRRLGRPISIFDAQIAAIARTYGAPIATRDAAGFADCGIDLIDPFS
jgi:predicted nucleic acid-binding protein